MSEDRADIEYELVVGEAGDCTLTCGGEVMWVSDADDDFAEDFPDALIEFADRDQVEEVVAWLRDEGYVPPDMPVHVLKDDSAETGNFHALSYGGGDDENEADTDV